MHNHSTGPQVIPNVMVAGAALYARDRGLGFARKRFRYSWDLDWMVNYHAWDR